MCGIHASISAKGFLTPSHGLKQLLCNRGPDYVGEAGAEIHEHGAPYYLSFTSTVLSLRGGDVTPQPFVDTKSGSILCWNGEAWKIGSESITGNDGQVVFDTLLEAIATNDVASESAIAILNVLNSISGPFAFVFLERTHEHIFFGRDRLGRRSLLYSANSNAVEFSSTADPLRGIWKEVEADGIYVLSLNHGALATREQNAEDDIRSLSILPLQKYGWDFGTSPSVC